MPAALQVMMDFLREWEEKLQIKITCSQVSLAGSPGWLGGGAGGTGLALRPDGGTAPAAECSAACRQAACWRPLGLQHACSSDRDAAGCPSGKKARLVALGQLGAAAASRLLPLALPGSAAWHQQPWLPKHLVCPPGRCTAQAGATALACLAASCCEHQLQHSSGHHPLLEVFDA